MRKFFIVIFIVFLMYACSAYAVDPSIVWGTWEYKSEDLTIKFRVYNNKLVFLEIGNEEFRNARFNTIYGLSPIYPFLTIIALKNGIEHKITLVVGEKSDSPELYLRGFYSIERIISKTDPAEVESKYFPIECHKVKAESQTLHIKE